MASGGLPSLCASDENAQFYQHHFQEQEQTTSHMSWSHNAHYNPYSLFSSAQGSARSWNPTEQTQPAVETSMQWSDEGDSRYDYSYGCLLTSSSIWSPLGGEKLQHFQADAKTQQKPTFLPNQTSTPTQGQAVGKNVNDFYQHCSDTSDRQLQPFSTYMTQSPQPPPNLPLPKKGSGYLPQPHWNTYNSTSALENTGSIQHLNQIPVLSEVFLPPNEMTGAPFRPHYDDQHIQNSAERLRYEPYSPQCINQIVNSFQSLMTADNGHFLPGDIPLLTGEKAGLYQEENINHVTTSTRAPSTTRMAKEMVGDYGKSHMEKNRAVRSKMSKCTSGSSANLPSAQNFQHTHFSSGGVQNRQQRIPLATKSALLPANVKGNHHYRSHPQQGQNRNKPQPAKEKRRTHTSGFQGEGYSTRSASSFHQKAAESKRYPPPNSVQTFAADNVGGKSLRLGPSAFNANDPAVHSGISFSSFMSGCKTPHGGSFTALETCDVMAANEVADLGPVSSDAANNQAAANLNVAAASAAPMNEAPVKQLQLCLEECHNQWKLLEMETEMTEAVLGKTPSRKETASAAKGPSEQSNVEQLLVNLTEAEEKVAGLLDRIEGLSVSLHINIHTALKRHHMAVSMTQARRKEGITNMMRRHQLAAPRTECRDTLLLSIALKDLAASTRKLRTALWCALQMALPKPVHRIDDMEEHKAATARPLPTMNTYFTL